MSQSQKNPENYELFKNIHGLIDKYNSGASINDPQLKVTQIYKKENNIFNHIMSNARDFYRKISLKKQINESRKKT